MHFRLLLKRHLPSVVLRLLFSRYKQQTLSIRWNSCYSPPFGVSNSVRQGGVFSPILFIVNLDELLTRLSKLGIGCHFDSIYGESFGYANDIALLAPSFAMRRLLRECELFANTTGLTFNASKTQLIYFQRAKSRSFLSRGVFSFFGSPLRFSESVNHLGHILHYTLTLQTIAGLCLIYAKNFF